MITNLCGLVVADVVEGTALASLPSALAAVRASSTHRFFIQTDTLRLVAGAQPASGVRVTACCNGVGLRNVAECVAGSDQG